MRSPEVDADRIILNATHTHSAPNATIGQYEAVPEGVMTPEEYTEVLLDGIADAVAEAWQNRKPGGVCRGLGTAVVGHNRRATYFQGSSGQGKPGLIINGVTRMYGNTNDPNFSHIEGYEDHYVNLPYTWDSRRNLTGVVVNLTCPSQETENDYYVSADFWHEVRTEIRKRHGSHIQVPAQCSAAGDQSSHRLWYKQAEERILKLRGMTMRQEIGRRVGHTVEDVLSAVRNDIRTDLTLKHVLRTMPLPRRMISDEEAEQLRSALAGLEAGDRKAGSYYSAVKRCRRVLQRYDIQNGMPTLPTQLHIVRLGDVAFATNRFELFLDYGIRIKARSPAVQTFVVQLTADRPHALRNLSADKTGARRKRVRRLRV